MTATAIDVLREPCQCCGLPMPLADLMFCRYGSGSSATTRRCAAAGSNGVSRG